MSRAIRNLLVAGNIRGELEPLKRLLARTPELGVDAIAVVGDLGAAWSKPDTYREVFRLLGESGLPTFWVPGPVDAPLGEYLSEAHNMEIVFPKLRGVHATAAQAGQLLFTGMGGEIVNDPDTKRDEEAMLRYPGWEVEYRLKIIREFKDRQKVFLFTTSPAQKGLHRPRERDPRGADQDLQPAPRRRRPGRRCGDADRKELGRLPGPARPGSVCARQPSRALGRARVARRPDNRVSTQEEEEHHGPAGCGGCSSRPSEARRCPCSPSPWGGHRPWTSRSRTMHSLSSFRPGSTRLGHSLATIEDDLIELCGVNPDHDPRGTCREGQGAPPRGPPPVPHDVECVHDEIEEWSFRGGRNFASVGSPDEEARPIERALLDVQAGEQQCAHCRGVRAHAESSARTARAVSTTLGHETGPVVETMIPRRLDRLPWSRWHLLVVVGARDHLDPRRPRGHARRGDRERAHQPGRARPLHSAIGLGRHLLPRRRVAGALVFGYLTDRFGRKKLFTVTLGDLPCLRPSPPAFAWNFASFVFFRFLTGAGIGGEYAAINSAIDELIPARVRGRVELAINGSWWVGTAVGARCARLLLESILQPATSAGGSAFGSARCSLSPSSSSAASSPRARAGS